MIADMGSLAFGFRQVAARDFRNRQPKGTEWSIVVSGVL